MGPTTGRARSVSLRTLPAVAVGAVLVALAPAPGSASEKLDGEDLRRAKNVRTQEQVAPNGTGSGYAYCPAKKRALTGGSYWHETGKRPTIEVADDASLAAASLTRDGKAWYGAGSSGFNSPTLVFTQQAVCVPRRKLSRAKLITRTVKMPYPAWDEPAKVRAKCPRGKRVVGGGAYVHRPGEGPAVTTATYLRASYPLKSGRGWQAFVRFSGTSEELRFTATALCAPRRSLARIAVRTKGETVFSPGLGGKRARCPKGYRALTGGAYWHRIGEPGGPTAEGIIAGTFGAPGRSWFVPGWNTSLQEARRLVTVVHCLRS